MKFWFSHTVSWVNDVKFKILFLRKYAKLCLFTLISIVFVVCLLFR